MPNPPLATRLERGNCFDCNAYGGLYPPQAKALVTICLRPADSGKEVSRMPESGCFMWRRREPEAKPPSP